LVATGDALGQIVIEDTPISDLDLVTTVSLYGYREITPSMLAYAGKKSTRAFYFSSWDELNEREREIKSGELRVGISERVIAAAFSSDFRFEKFRETREGQNPVDVSFPIIAWGLANIQKQEKPELVKQKLIFQDLPVGGDAKAKAVYDSALMVNLASVGFYGNAATKENMLDWYIGTTNTKVRFVEVNSAIINNVAAIYKAVEDAKKLPPRYQAEAIGKAHMLAAGFPLVSDQTRYRAGEVSYGKPLVYTAKEKKLELPESITDEYSVYWIEFAITLKDIDTDATQSITFQVKTEDDCIALELLPLSVTTESLNKMVVKSPTVSVGKYSLGEIFSREVSYRSLEATITASGLQENVFSWTLSGKAVLWGSKRFVAVIATPRKSGRFPFEFLVTLKSAPKRSFLPGLPRELELISHAPLTVYLSLVGRSR
jgi:hypothetical protein